MSRSPRLLIVARDPGAASALVPVASAGAADVVAFPHAAPFFERAQIPFQRIEEDRDAGLVGSLIDALRPDVLVTGTSLRAERDGFWWAAARGRGIPSLAVLDHWAHYAERFTVRDPFDRLPDRVAVMDDRAQRALIKLGCSVERLVVTGQPALDAVLDARPTGRREARGHWGIGGSTWVILFASEPIALDIGAARAYDETGALAVLLEACAGMPADVVVRLHPRESREAIAARFPEVRIDAAVAPRAAMAGADTIVGMTSMFLLEAALAGMPVLSIQPSQEVELVPGDRPLLIALARTVAETRAWLADPTHRASLSDADRAARNLKCGFLPGATARVLREAARLVSA